MTDFQSNRNLGSVFQEEYHSHCGNNLPDITTLRRCFPHQTQP